MTQVIYIDILVIVNIYIGYALLRLTGIVCSSRVKRLRILLSSALQGLYSMVILLPPVPALIRLPARLAVCGLFIAAAFELHSRKEFFRLYAAFLGLSFGFAGIMLAIWMFFAPGVMSYNNGAVYFTVDALTLAVATVVCYTASRLIYALIRLRSPKGSIYTLTIRVENKSVSCRALYDSGNSLCDAFSGLPVIIIDEPTARELVGQAADMESLSRFPGFRMIPCETINAQSALPAFRPQSITIESLRIKHTTSAVYIGVSRTKIGNGEFGALLGARVLQNAEERKVSENDTVFIGKHKAEKNSE